MSDKKYGPYRKAPQYYVGETIGSRQVNYPDVERYPGGRIPGVRNKLARRRIRGAMRRTFSAIERGLLRARALKAQAMELARDDKKSTRWGRRLFDRELALHQPVQMPNQKEARAMRTAARRKRRAAL